MDPTDAFNQSQISHSNQLPEPLLSTDPQEISNINTTSGWLDDDLISYDSDIFNDFSSIPIDSTNGKWPLWPTSNDSEIAGLADVFPPQQGRAEEELNVLDITNINDSGLFGATRNECPVEQTSDLVQDTKILPSAPKGFSNVSQWLEGAYSPPVPCSYCFKNRLQCLIIRTTPANPNPVTSCSSCVALFRECSLAQGEKRHPSEFETMSPVLGHLHGVPEQIAKDNGSTICVDNTETGDKQKEPKQFVRKGARVLREWFLEHQERPYPSEDQYLHLSQQTGFSKKRLSTWFANARRRQKQKLQCLPQPQIFRAGSPIPTRSIAAMTPMERWQASPPEDEPVPELAIQKAIASTSTETNSGIAPALLDVSAMDPFDLEETSSHLTSSVSSFGSRVSEGSSSSLSSVWSHHSSWDGPVPFPLLPKRSSTRQRRGRQRQQTNKEGQYQCTFCIKSFKKKHDWCRHEKSVHLSLDSWVCTPNLSELQSPGNPPSHCRCCESLLPTHDHWEEHEFHICAQKPVADRSFSRKDYLWQHLQKFHGCTKTPVSDLDAWRFSSVNVQSRCGFCGSSLPCWTGRAGHLAAHFKEGSRMSQWEGDWGFESSILSLLRDATLPSQRPSLDISS